MRFQADPPCCCRDGGNDVNDPKRSLWLRRSTGIPALPNVKTACSWRGIVPLTRQPSHKEGHMPVNIGRRELIAALGSAAEWPLAAPPIETAFLQGFKDAIGSICDRRCGWGPRQRRWQN